MAEIADPGNVIIRRSGIGGSDIAPIAGVGKWGTPMSVWLEKTAQSAPLIENDRMHWGKVLEEPVAREYARVKGCKVVNARTVTDPVTHLRARVIRPFADKPWRMAHVDRLVSGQRRGLEVKTAAYAGQEWGEEGSDQIPADYRLQVSWYLALTGYEAWDVAVLIGGNDFRIYTVLPDPELAEMLFTVADSFWIDNYLARVAPDIDGSDDTRRWLESKHIGEAAIEMSDTLYDLALRRETLTREVKDREVEKDEVENRIRAEMGAAGRAARDNVKVTWSVGTTRRLDGKALAEAHPKLAARFYRESETHRLTVTVREQA